MIKIQQLTKRFHTGKAEENTALKDISLTISDGQFVTIVGSNGSGKSTLLNMIAGSLFPSAGTIEIDDIKVTHLPEYRRSKWIGRVFQNPLLGTAGELSIVDNFRLAALRTSHKMLKIGNSNLFRNQVSERISTLGMGLENKLDQPIGSLSGGQRQALTLLMSVFIPPKVLLLDEPTAALDPKSAAVIMETANTLIARHQLTAIFITHNLKEAYQYGNRIIQMSEGAIIKDLNQVEKSSLQLNTLFEWFS